MNQSSVANKAALARRGQMPRLMRLGGIITLRCNASIC